MSKGLENKLNEIKKGLKNIVKKGKKDIVYAAFPIVFGLTSCLDGGGGSSSSGGTPAPKQGYSVVQPLNVFIRGSTDNLDIGRNDVSLGAYQGTLVIDQSTDLGDTVYFSRQDNSLTGSTANLDRTSPTQFNILNAPTPSLENGIYKVLDRSGKEIGTARKGVKSDETLCPNTRRAVGSTGNPNLYDGCTI